MTASMTLCDEFAGPRGHAVVVWDNDTIAITSPQGAPPRGPGSRRLACSGAVRAASTNLGVLGFWGIGPHGQHTKGQAV